MGRYTLLGDGDGYTVEVDYVGTVAHQAAGEEEREEVSWAKTVRVQAPGGGFGLLQRPGLKRFPRSAEGSARRA